MLGNCSPPQRGRIPAPGLGSPYSRPLRPTPESLTNPPLPSRSYQTPVRDEESESQRKARSRLMRQSRRSTQGVTLTDLKEAEKTIGRSGDTRAAEQRIGEDERRDREKEQPPEATDSARRCRPAPSDGAQAASSERRALERKVAELEEELKSPPKFPGDPKMFRAM
nr:protein phosphatase 1 regulatory subunit 12C-like [Pelodiscus sinensis]|eukprot:XP_025043788.1 protein phosphatase 1 regulatory subunit 12C-like [Pelodiscus sinensis]